MPKFNTSPTKHTAPTSTHPDYGVWAKLTKDVKTWAHFEARKVPFRDHVEQVTLLGMCAIAATELHKRLVAQGWKDAQLAAAYNDELGGHAYVVIDGWRLDPTAFQFKLCASKAVIVEPHHTQKGPWFYKHAQTFNTVSTFVTHLSQLGWNPHHLPSVESTPTEMAP